MNIPKEASNLSDSGSKQSMAKVRPLILEIALPEPAWIHRKSKELVQVMDSYYYKLN